MLPSEVRAHVRRIRIKAKKAVTSFTAGCYRSAFHGRGSELEDLRGYAVGDDLKAIDWKVTARTGRPHVKTFREERDLRVLALFDVSASMRFGTKGGFKLDRALEALAFVGFTAVASNDRFGSLFFTDRIELFIPPSRGDTQVLKIVRQALALSPHTAETNISAALLYLSKLRLKRSVVFIISDFQSAEYFKSLQILAHQHEIICIVVTDRGERDLPASGLISLKDPESEQVVALDLGNNKVQRALKHAKLHQHQHTIQRLRKARVQHIEIDTTEEAVKKMSYFFYSRADQGY